MVGFDFLELAFLACWFMFSAIDRDRDRDVLFIVDPQC